jgi:hypothetical protein
VTRWSGSRLRHVAVSAPPVGAAVPSTSLIVSMLTHESDPVNRVVVDVSAQLEGGADQIFGNHEGSGMRMLDVVETIHYGYP